jgi:hypothetical protein
MNTKTQLAAPQAAARIGPGYRGERADLAKEDRIAQAAEILSTWDADRFGSPPRYLVDLAQGKVDGWTHRKAKLFECGSYHDKSIVVDPAALQRLAESFDLPVPVLIEHVEDPFRLGYLTQVEAHGAELFGILALTPEASGLVDKTGANALSLSVSRSLDRIFEVSIVANPRVPSAKLFCESFEASEGSEEAARLRAEIDRRDTEDTVNRLLDAGRITPFAKDAALSLLQAAKSRGIQQEFERFLESLPKAIVFGELVPAGAPEPRLSSEEAAFYARCFPNLDPSEIAKRKVS